MGARGELFTTQIYLDNRSYFFNVKENRTGDVFLQIVESKNRDGVEADRHQIAIFADDLQKFLQGMEKSLSFVEKDRKGIYDDRNGYMLVAVRETMEKVITEYVESYFGEGNAKVYIHPYLAEMVYGDEINEDTVKDKVKTTAVLFVPDEICTKAQMDAFSDTYKTDGHDFVCKFRATIISKTDFDGLTYNNCGDMYDYEHMIYDTDIE